METGWKHQSHEIQREFERIRRQSSSSKKEGDDGATPIQSPASPQKPPQSPQIGISGAINAETASPPLYRGFRLKSPKATCDITKVTNAADKLFVFQIDRPLTVEHNEVAVDDQTVPATYSDTVKFIDFKDDLTAGGVVWTVTNYDETKIQVEGHVTLGGGGGDVCVTGENIGTYPSTSLPYEWYVDTIIDGDGCFDLRFKKFQASNDLVVTSGTNSYLLDVNILGDNLTDVGEGIFYDKSGSTLRFKGLRAGTGISITTLDDDPNPGNRDIVISCTVTDTNTTYAHSAETTTGGAFLRLTGSDATTDDVKFASGTGITVTRTDSNTITITCNVTDTNNTYSLDNEGTGHSIYDSSADLVAGSNTTYYLRRLYGLGATTVATDGTRITISSTDTDTTYSISAETTTGGAYLRLTDSGAGTDDVKFASGTGITVTRTDANTITIACSVTDTNTTYSHTAVSTTGGAFLRLAGSDATNDDVKFASGTGITVTRIDADTIEIACTVTDTNTTYDHSVVDVSGSIYVRLHGSDSSNDDILFQSSDASITITRIDANTIDFVGSTGGGGTGLTYDILAVTHASGAKLRLHGSGGSTDDVLFREGTGIAIDYIDDNTIEIACTVTDTNTTYSHKAVTAATGAKVRLHGSDLTDDDILFKEGTGITIDYIDDDTIEIACTVTDTNTTYDHKAVTAATGAKIRLHGSDATNDDILLREGTGITIDYIDDDTIEIACSVTDTNTVYDHKAVTAANGAKVRLHGSDATNDDILFREGTGITIDYIDDDTIEIACTVTDTNSITVVDNCAGAGGTGEVWHDTTVAGSTTTYHLRKLLAGTGIDIATLTHDIQISCTLEVVYYDHKAVTAANGAKIRLHGSDATNDDILLREGTGIAIDYIDDDTIEISCTVTDTNTTYDHLVVTATGGAKLRLHSSTAVNDDVLFTSAGNTVIITRTDDDTMNFEVDWDTMPFNVVGTNINDCNITSAPYGWYIDYTDAAGTRTLNFRGFQVSNDLILTECVSNYILDVNITASVMTTLGESIYIGKVGSQLRLRGLLAGTGVTITQLDGDPNPTDSDLIISATGTTYDISAVDISGVANLRLTGSDATTDDVAFVGTGSITVTRTDADTITIDGTDTDTTYTYHLLDGSPAPGTGTSDKVILRLHESTGTDYDITFREGVGISFSRTGEQLSIIGNMVSLSTLDGTPAPGSGTTDQIIIRATNSNDGSTSDITLNEGSGIVLTRSGSNITIASTGGTTSDVDNCATGGGAQVFHDTTVAGSNTTYHLRTINANDGYLTVTQNTHEIVISATNPLHWYAYGDQGGGSHSLRGTITGTGTYASPYVFNFKTVNAGNGILITDATNLLTIKTDFKVTAMGLDQTEVSTLEFVDQQYGIVAIHDTGTANKSKITLVDYNYNTAWDSIYFCDSAVKTTDKTLADDTWEKLYWHIENINDVPNWVYADETEVVNPPWYFMPDDTEDHVWQVTVRLFALGRYPTSNTIAASVYYPQIALFIGDSHYRTLDVNTDLHLAAQLRDTLLRTGVISGSDVTEAGTKFFLEGTGLVKLTNNSHKLNVRMKHQTGSSRYIKLKEGSIEITKVGVKGTVGSHPTAAISYNQT